MNAEELQNVTDKIVHQFQPDKVILFGSQAWGTPTADSDLDLLVIKDTANTLPSSIPNISLLFNQAQTLKS